MTAQTYQIISRAGLILTVVFLAISLMLWIKFGIWKIIGDLSGKTAKKSIARMLKGNEESGKKQYRFTSAFHEREKVSLTETAVTAETAVEEQTELLNAATELLGGESVIFTLIKDIVYVHTDETI